MASIDGPLASFALRRFCAFGLADAGLSHIQMKEPTMLFDPRFLASFLLVFFSTLRLGVYCFYGFAS